MASRTGEDWAGRKVPPAGMRAGQEGAAGRAGPTPGAVARLTGGRLGVVGWLRWGWRQLTSMRTALVLLFLLALASIPGSVLPQQGIDPAAVTQYSRRTRRSRRFLARLSAFDVFGAPWFAAIYLLLFTSLAGCVLPGPSGSLSPRGRRRPGHRAAWPGSRMPRDPGWRGARTRPWSRPPGCSAGGASGCGPRRLGVGGKGLPA